VTLKVAQTGTCRVLHLELGELRLNLLGLIVLLCQLIQSLGSTTTAPAATAANLSAANKMIKKKYSAGVISFNAPLKSAAPTATAAATTSTGTTTATGTTTTGTSTSLQSGQCEVLNLLLGPLNLDLLGLVVQVNKIDLDISANPVGTLGTLFCQLAGND